MENISYRPHGLVSFSLFDKNKQEFLSFNDREVFYDVKHLRDCLRDSECEDSKINGAYYLSLAKENV